MGNDLRPFSGSCPTPAGAPEAILYLLQRKKLFLEYGYDLDGERDALLDQLGSVRGKVLEVGTGKGHFALALARRGVAFTTVDISREESEIARVYLAFHGLEKFADFRLEKDDRLSFSGGSYDWVLSVNLLHHLKNPRETLGEFIRVLRPEGTLMLSDFTEEGFGLMDKIHALDGRVHDRGVAPLAQAVDFLTETGMRLEKRWTSRFQQSVLLRRSR
ncbi:MAG: class I SAM-dependent methyltransferase [Candidatus Omnitrophica bacterium]|nr:class I SAM-dependent methyltransferase [Candidatus Omnitrophota bacterium]